MYWRKAIETTEKAIMNSSLYPIKTDLTHFKVNNDIVFDIRSIDSTRFKFPSIIGPLVNPFCPWDKQLEIDKIRDTHVLILNKYPVQIGHMLLIPNHWKPQNGWLDLEDMKSLIEIEKHTKGLWFFNSCHNSGASQTHRHIQLLPRHSLNNICPLQCLYKDHESCREFLGYQFSSKIYTIQRGIKNEEAKDLLEIYLELSRRIGNDISTMKIKPENPYNLLLGPDWMTIVKRKKEYSHGFSLNALAFAGYILATSNSDINWLNNNGPLSLLKSVI